MAEPTIFTKIINREIPAHIIYEDDRVISFLTIQPISQGHALVVPKKQVDQIWDLEVEDYDYLWDVAKKIATHLRSTLSAMRVAVVVKGFDVPHAHIHLIPIPHGAAVDLDPFPGPPQKDNNQLAQIAGRIKM